MFLEKKLQIWGFVEKKGKADNIIKKAYEKEQYQREEKEPRIKKCWEKSREVLNWKIRRMQG